MFKQTIQQGEQLLVVGQYRKALEIFASILNEDINNIAAFYGSGESLYWLREYERALQFYEKVLDIDPHHLEALRGKGAALRMLNKLEQSLEVTSLALKIDKENAEVLYSNGMTLLCLKKKDEAASYFERAFEEFISAIKENGNNVRVLYRIGSCYQYGFGTGKDLKKAIEHYTTAANAGDLVSQYELGCYYANGEEATKNLEEAFKWYRKAAEQEDPDAQCELGHCYLNGKGVAKDEAEALIWYQKAILKKSRVAYRQLGICYEEGLGVKKNPAQSFEYYTKSAELGDAISQYQVGNLLATKDPMKAKWYMKAAKQNHIKAQNKLGWCYSEGIGGVDKDLKQAVEWFIRAASQEDADAQYNLGVSFEEGFGVEKDLSEAIVWYAKSASQGMGKAKTFLELCYINQLMSVKIEAEYLEETKDYLINRKEFLKTYVEKHMKMAAATLKFPLIEDYSEERYINNESNNVYNKLVSRELEFILAPYINLLTENLGLVKTEGEELEFLKALPFSIISNIIFPFLFFEGEFHDTSLGDVYTSSQFEKDVASIRTTRFRLTNDYLNDYKLLSQEELSISSILPQYKFHQKKNEKPSFGLSQTTSENMRNNKLNCE